MADAAAAQKAPGASTSLPGARVETEKKVLSFWEDVWWRFRKQKVAVGAGILLIAILIIALSASLVAPYHYDQQFRSEGLTAGGKPVAPNAKFWLGTDGLGRDMLSRILYGARVSLAVGFSASLIATLIGVIVGGLAGYAGGAVDFGLMRFVDLMMSIPQFLLMLMLVVILKPGVWVVVFVISLFSWTWPSRIFRSQVVSIKAQDFILAARAVGVPERRIFLQHVMPHLAPLTIVYVALGIPTTIFTESGLSFLGLGVPPPMPSWGSMMQAGIQFYRVAPWVVLFPGLAIMVTVICLNMVGTALRECMDPTQRGR